MLSQEEAEKYLIFRLGDKYFCTRLRYIVRVTPFENVWKVPLARKYFEGLISFENKAIPLYNLISALGSSGAAPSVDNLVAVDNIEGNNIGFLIEGVEKVAMLDSASFSDYDEGIPAVKRKTRWEGKDIYLLDIKELMSISQ